MYHVSAQGVDERMINIHYYYPLNEFFSASAEITQCMQCIVWNVLVIDCS